MIELNSTYYIAYD